MSDGAAKIELGSDSASVLELPASLVAQMGSRQLEVSSPGDLGHLGLILQDLRGEDCGHSWRNLLLEIQPTSNEDLAQALLVQVEQGRPTTLFTYALRDSEGEVVPVAVATISDSVARGFPHEGFPVLARCFIRKPFRGMGLYPLLVQHRMERCGTTYGDALRAVHIGAAREPVLSTLERGVGLEPRFLYVGDELLSVTGEEYRVRDFVAPLPGFRAALLECEEPLRSLIDRFLQEGAEAVSVSRIREEVVGGAQSVPLSVRQLLDLMDAIGVIS
ncbi:MAG: hypothetical protein VX519_01625 [Myxococcota bacterium]|nr:hypothetical protein [Myxococcota bacterium]